MKKKYWMLATFFILFCFHASALAQEIPVYKEGMEGQEVLKIQRLLAQSGYYAGVIDGIFGSATGEAVEAFQVVNGLAVDGMVGRQTLLYLERTGGLPNRYNRAVTMTASAYTAYDDGNSNYTYRGNMLRKGLAAVDPRVIPLGSRLYIEGYGYAIADDIGGAIKGNRIDLAYESRDEAFKFGLRKVTVYILD